MEAGRRDRGDDCRWARLGRTSLSGLWPWRGVDLVCDGDAGRITMFNQTPAAPCRRLAWRER